MLGSIEFLANFKCLIIICCFLPAEFWQKYAEVSELTGHVRTSGYYGTQPIWMKLSEKHAIKVFYAQKNGIALSIIHQFLESFF